MQVALEEIETAESENLVRLRLITHNARLVDTRKERGITQLEMAQAAGVRLHHLRGIENLKRNPAEDEMAKIACVLLKPIDYLFPEELLSAVEAGVFSRRKVELAAPQVIALTEAQRRRLLPASGLHELEEEVERKLLSQQLSQQVQDVLGTLKPRERHVLELRFGLGDEGPLTLEAIGKKPEFSVLRERIRQIEAKALRKLRHPARSRELKDFLD